MHNNIHFVDSHYKMRVNSFPAKCTTTWHSVTYILRLLIYSVNVACGKRDSCFQEETLNGEYPYQCWSFYISTYNFQWTSFVNAKWSLLVRFCSFDCRYVGKLMNEF